MGYLDLAVRVPDEGDMKLGWAQKRDLGGIATTGWWFWAGGRVWKANGTEQKMM